MAARPDSPWLAFWLASISGLAEPVGAVVALSALQNTQSKLPLENVLAAVAGIMCMVAIKELYPEAVRALPSIPPPRMRNSKGGGNNNNIRLVILSLLDWYSYWYRYYQQILTGTIVGMILMIATELYL